MDICSRNLEIWSPLKLAHQKHIPTKTHIEVRSGILAKFSWSRNTFLWTTVLCRLSYSRVKIVDAIVLLQKTFVK